MTKRKYEDVEYTLPVQEEEVVAPQAEESFHEETAQEPVRELPFYVFEFTTDTANLWLARGDLRLVHTLPMVVWEAQVPDEKLRKAIQLAVNSVKLDGSLFVPSALIPHPELGGWEEVARYAGDFVELHRSAIE